MLLDNFNKLGGTEFRVKNQINGLSQIIYWIFDIQKNNKHKVKDFSWDIEFKNWINREQIYTYQKNINRFDMITSFLTNKIPILEFNPLLNEFYLSKTIINNSKTNITNIDSILDINTWFQAILNARSPSIKNAFNAFIQFIWNQDQEVDFKKVTLAFFVYDGKEEFSYLYNHPDLLEQLATKKYNHLKLNIDKWFKKLDFRKPPNNIDFYKKIFSKKYNNQKIDLNDLLNYDQNKDRHLKQIFFKNQQRFKTSIFIDALNNISFEQLVIKFIKIKYTNLLLDEYLDLFSRWLFEFGLLNSSGKKIKYLSDYKSILKKTNNHFYIEQNKILHSYPFSLDETISFIKSIQNNDWSFKFRDNNLKDIQSFTLAEYFVNLFFCYKFNIKTIDFKKYVNTKCCSKFYPIFVASGGVSDMWYQTDNFLFTIETTIIKNKNALIKSEAWSSFSHIKKLCTSYEHKQKFITYLITPIFKKDFIDGFLPYYKENQKFYIEAIRFDELLNLELNY